MSAKTAKSLDKSLLPMCSNEDLAELVRLGDITDHDATMAKYRRLAARTLRDPVSREYLKFKAAHDKAQR